MVQFRNHNVVLSFVSSVIDSFLTRHGFAYQKPLERRSSTNDGSSSPRKKRRLASEDHQRSENRGCDGPNDVILIPPSQLLHINPDDSDGYEVIWKDPTTGEIFVVDQRTGNSYPQETQPFGTDEGGENGKRRRTLRKKSDNLYSIEDITEDNSATPSWLQQALRANKAYTLTESKIPSLSLSSTFMTEMQDSNSSRHNHHACNSKHEGVSRYFQYGHTNPKSKPPSRRFSKEDLSNAHIISQVDRKFIACLIRDGVKTPDGDQDQVGPAQTLVLIDQHAADERVRVERFLKELCLGFLHHHDKVDGVPMRMLTQSVPVLLTRHEASCLAESDIFQRAFECWGVTFDSLSSLTSRVWDGDLDDINRERYVQVFVRSVPMVVCDKLLVGDELRELIKGFLARLIEDKSAFSLAAVEKPISEEEATHEPFFWLKALRWCPRELLDLINSKACRGAIMFNDSLTIDQCQRLVRQLSETAFPFQCAHGRPSLVPLVNVGDQEVANGRCRASQVEWDWLV